ncbi:MAG TPA: hypothetical protein VNZ05_06805 [Solirubrobacteraceae bacterium]|jgi:hypothetical protein|nr:hypothetical protein [Solirubrobacteraceae bacterium]
MDVVPMFPSCALDEAGLRKQYERYREVGVGARVLERRRRRLTVDLDQQVDPKLVAELLAVERECCPFLELGWEQSERRLTAAVSRTEHEPALDAIAFALGLKGPLQSAASD